MKTVPASIRSANRRALLISEVNIPEASPYSVALERLRTPSMSLRVEVRLDLLVATLLELTHSRIY